VLWFAPHVLQVEEQKRRAEADKLAALTALETASAEFMREKEEKKELEAKIAAMQVRAQQQRSFKQCTTRVAVCVCHLLSGSQPAVSEA
jgi:hypothetical protein